MGKVIDYETFLDYRAAKEVAEAFPSMDKREVLEAVKRERDTQETFLSLNSQYEDDIQIEFTPDFEIDGELDFED